VWPTLPPECIASACEIALAEIKFFDGSNSTRGPRETASMHRSRLGAGTFNLATSIVE